MKPICFSLAVFRCQIFPHPFEYHSIATLQSTLFNIALFSTAVLIPQFCYTTPPDAQGPDVKQVLEANGIIHFPGPEIEGFGWDNQVRSRMHFRCRNVQLMVFQHPVGVS